MSFHLLPLPASKASNDKPAPKPKAKPDPGRSRSPPPSNRNNGANQPAKGKGKGKKGKRGRDPNVPKGLIGKSLQTSDGERVCWAFNLEQGCKDAKPGEKCPADCTYAQSRGARSPIACKVTDDKHHRAFQFCLHTPFETTVSLLKRDVRLMRFIALEFLQDRVALQLPSDRWDCETVLELM